ncbi:MAG: hypothetical protein ACFFCW_47320 [Candidatus Hodarchaeota archaeon]
MELSASEIPLGQREKDVLRYFKKNPKKILLVEPGYKSILPPLGLMRISSLHKKIGNKVDFVKENPPADYFGYIPPNLERRYDLIYVTSLFTYDYGQVIDCIRKYQLLFPHAKIKVGGVLATLLPELVRKETGVILHTGLMTGAEKCPPDYSLFPKLKYSITFTTRGCVRKCKYCVVSKVEPKFFVREHWERDIAPNHGKIIFWDNNWLLSPNFYEDVRKLKEIGKPYDFNQGLDCRLFDEEKAKLLRETKIEPLRFAFDSPSHDGYIQKAIELAKKHEFSDIRVYVLYNSEEEYDTPEYFYNRITGLNKLGAAVYPMRYRPIDGINPHWVSPRWDKDVLRGLKLIMVFFYKGGIIKKGRHGFRRMFGRSPDEFERKMKKIKAYDRALWRRRNERRS